MHGRGLYGLSTHCNENARATTQQFYSTEFFLGGYGGTRG